MEAFVAALCPPLTDAAHEMLRAVDRSPHDETARAACVDALEASGAHFLAAVHRAELLKLRYLRLAVAEFALPARFASNG